MPQAKKDEERKKKDCFLRGSKGDSKFNGYFACDLDKPKPKPKPKPPPPEPPSPPMEQVAREAKASWAKYAREHGIDDDSSRPGRQRGGNGKKVEPWPGSQQMRDEYEKAARTGNWPLTEPDRERLMG